MLYDKMATGDVTFTQDGAGNVKLHPYLITLVRWCVSCLWSTASVFLHRLVTTPLPPITAPKLSSKPRQAGTDHLHPEPKVECVVLHTPESPTLDVIFVHGLYGSLGNTWRQGDWRAKYKLDPTKVPLRNHTCNPCKCQTTHEQPYNNIHFTYETNLNETELNDTLSFKQINGCLKKILPNENSFITEKFYNNTFLNVNVNYETQGKFVTELFKTDCNKNCDLNIECKLNGNVNKCKCKINGNCKRNECNCEINDEFKLDKCGVGCGCICDDCYSSCWPRDWIKEDFPGARVISINYTSDPYLWRPLWVKASKRLRLHERAEQMTEQLLDLGVGKRPIIWVGHSKGGLFIKQIYCEAYEAYMKINKNVNKNKINNNTKDQSNNSDNINNNYNSYEENEFNNRHDKNKEYCNDIPSNKNNENNDQQQFTKKDKNTEKILVKDKNIDKIDIFGDINEESEFDNLIDISIYNNEDIENLESNGRSELNMVSSYKEGKIEIQAYGPPDEDFQALETRSSLWLQSAGFMFYSVPHRGSPLAAIKTPITARSIELLEISKDCQLVQQLQSRWLLAASSSRPLVRSLVETCRTLMSVLWLRIVSVDSADAGLGSLHGVSVDHREICKPSSRNCLLYTELTDLIQKSLNKCNCRTNS